MRLFHKANLEKGCKAGAADLTMISGIFRELHGACNNKAHTGVRNLPRVWQAERRETNLMKPKIYKSLASVPLQFVGWRNVNLLD